jgi:hypothetical protein
VTAAVPLQAWDPRRKFSKLVLIVLQGVRVEVNGQVLSQGGNLGADRITDTTSAMQVAWNVQQAAVQTAS